MQNVKDSVFICRILLCFLLCFPTSKLGKYFAAFLRILSIFWGEVVQPYCLLEAPMDYVTMLTQKQNVVIKKIYL
jgi:hypothetical protein